MACIRKRRGKWVVDFRDYFRDSVGIRRGRRRWKTCETRRQAEDVLEEKLRESRQPARPMVDLDITISAYAERWLGFVRASLKPSTFRFYEQKLRLHVLPASEPSESVSFIRARLKPC